LKQSIKQCYAKIFMVKSRKTFDHEMGQVHKDDKGDHGTLYFKPSL
jgi:hypothetical protein